MWKCVSASIIYCIPELRGRWWCDLKKSMKWTKYTQNIYLGDTGTWGYIAQRSYSLLVWSYSSRLTVQNNSSSIPCYCMDSRVTIMQSADDSSSCFYHHHPFLAAVHCALLFYYISISDIVIRFWVFKFSLHDRKSLVSHHCQFYPTQP